MYFPLGIFIFQNAGSQEIYVLFNKHHLLFISGGNKIRLSKILLRLRFLTLTLFIKDFDHP